LERERETAVVAQALERAATGGGALVAIEGGPGIGKSALLAAARELALARGLQSRHVPAGEDEYRSSYAAVRELVEAFLDDRGRPTGAEDKRLRALPDLLDPARDSPPPELSVARGLRKLLVGATADGPLLVTIDDVHSSDVASLRVLVYVARRLTDVGVVLCVAARPVIGTEAPGSLVDALLAEAGEWTLHPAALSAAGSATLVAQRLGDGADPMFCAACHRDTGGNPLLLRELIRALAAEGIAPAASQVEAIRRVGGPAVSRTVRLWLGALPPAATRLAQAVAMLGDGTPIAHAARLARLDSETAFEAAAGLGALEVLTGGGHTIFVHPLVRQAVLSGLTPAEAAGLHEAAAGLLSELGAPVERIAAHLLHAPARDSASAARILREAGSAAAARGDPRTATALLARSLEEAPAQSDRVDILLELAAAERFSDLGTARGHAQAALAQTNDPAKRAAAALQLAVILPAIDPRGTIEVLEPHVERLGDPETQLRGLAVMLTGAVLDPAQLPWARKIATELRPQLDAPTPAARMAAAVVGYLDALENRPAREVLATIEQALTAPLDPPQILGQLTVGMIALIAADSAHAMPVCDNWKALADRTGLAGQAAGVRMCRSHALIAHGRLSEALVDARSGVEVCQLYVGGAPVNWSGAALVEALIETGELEEARRMTNQILAGPAPAWTVDLHGLLGCQARLDALEGNPVGALKRTLELGRRCEQARIYNPALVPWRSRAARLLHGSGEDDRAPQLAAEEVELARTWGAPRALGRALSTLAAVTDDLALHAEAVEVLADSPASLELAKANLGLGAALRRHGERSAPRQPLRQAAALAAECGATPVAARARDELVATGARPRRTAISGPAALTAQERRVAEAAAGGLANQQIAERLYVVPSTVESHLVHAYRKLGISSRSQLPHALEHPEAVRRHAEPIQDERGGQEDP
jgi:DNA-binding CsgD family transcriptional regulator